MKQVFLLDVEEMKRLNGGDELQFLLGNQELAIMAASPRRGGRRKKEEGGNPGSAADGLTCEHCGTRFARPQAMAAHLRARARRNGACPTQFGHTRRRRRKTRII